MSDDNKKHDATIEYMRIIEEKAFKRLNVIKIHKEREIILCSFCGKLHNEVQVFIRSDAGVTICNKCVAFCNKLLNDKGENYILT